MPIANAWICRGCWKPNKQGAARCFQCKLPRDADAAQIHRQAAQDSARAAIPDPVPDIIVTVPAAIFRWYGRALLVLGALLFVIVLMDAMAGAPEWQVIPGAVVMVALVACGLLFRALAEAMNDRNPWGFVAAVLVAGALTAWAAYQLFVLPVPLGNIPPQAAIIRTWGTLLISGSAALCAFMGLVLIAIRGRIQG